MSLSPSSPPSLLSPPQSGPSPPLVRQRASGGTRSLGGCNRRPRCAAAQPLRTVRPSRPLSPWSIFLSRLLETAPLLGFPPASLAVSCCLRGILPLRGSPLSIRGLRGTALDGSVFSGDHAPSTGLNCCPRICGLVTVLPPVPRAPARGQLLFQYPRGDPSRRLR